MLESSKANGNGFRGGGDGNGNGTTRRAGDGTGAWAHGFRTRVSVCMVHGATLVCSGLVVWTSQPAGRWLWLW